MQSALRYASSSRIASTRPRVVRVRSIETNASQVATVEGFEEDPEAGYCSADDVEVHFELRKDL